MPSREFTSVGDEAAAMGLSEEEYRRRIAADTARLYESGRMLRTEMEGGGAAEAYRRQLGEISRARLQEAQLASSLGVGQLGAGSVMGRRAGAYASGAGGLRMANQQDQMAAQTAMARAQLEQEQRAQTLAAAQARIEHNARWRTGMPVAEAGISPWQVAGNIVGGAGSLASGLGALTQGAGGGGGGGAGGGAYGMSDVVDPWATPSDVRLKQDVVPLDTRGRQRSLRELLDEEAAMWRGY